MVSIKQLFAIIIIFFAVTDFCLAEEVNEENVYTKIKPKSRIGGTIGIRFPEGPPGLVGTGGNIFYNQIFNKFFLSANAGLNHYTSDRIYQIDIPITIGINTITDNKRFNFYCGIEAGLLKQGVYYDDSNEKISSNISGIIVPSAGLFISVTKNISIILNLKLQFGMIYPWNEKEYFGLYSGEENIGLSFSF